MKKLLFTSLFIFSVFSSFSQDIQLHYNYGHYFYQENKGFPKITASVEISRADKWGSNYLIVDMDCSTAGINGLYFEFERQLQFWKGPWSIRVEYCGGYYTVYHHVFDLGPTFTHFSKDGSRGFSLTAMYMHHFEQDHKHSPKLSAFWINNLLKGKFTMVGYADLWEFYGIRFITEPQFWVNLNKFKGINPNFNLALGGEIKISYNLLRSDKFCIIPTLAMKWNF